MFLPWPPSSNVYWRYTQRRVLVSKAARKYKQDVKWYLYTLKKPRLDGRLRALITVYPPDKRKRDLDNYQKIVLDSLKKILFDDDCQFDDLHTIRGKIVKGGALEVTLDTLKGSTNDIKRNTGRLLT